jgi:hypothetical protein
MDWADSETGHAEIRHAAATSTLRMIVSPVDLEDYPDRPACNSRVALLPRNR